MFSSIFFAENLGITICSKNTDRAQFGWYSDIQNTSILSAQLYSGDAANIYDGIFNLKVFCEKKVWRSKISIRVELMLKQQVERV